MPLHHLLRQIFLYVNPRINPFQGIDPKSFLFCNYFIFIRVSRKLVMEDLKEVYVDGNERVGGSLAAK